MGGHTKGEGSGFGPRLKNLREKAGLSQAQLAERSGMNVFGVAKLEQGQRDPSWQTVLSLAKALGVDCTAFASEAPAATAPEAPAKPPKKGGKK